MEAVELPLGAGYLAIGVATGERCPVTERVLHSFEFEAKFLPHPQTCRDAIEEHGDLRRASFDLGQGALGGFEGREFLRFHDVDGRTFGDVGSALN